VMHEMVVQWGRMNRRTSPLSSTEASIPQELRLSNAVCASCWSSRAFSGRLTNLRIVSESIFMPVKLSIALWVSICAVVSFIYQQFVIKNYLSMHWEGEDMGQFWYNPMSSGHKRNTRYWALEYIIS
jgi:hypothetical protein